MIGHEHVVAREEWVWQGLMVLAELLGARAGILQKCRQMTI